MDSTKLPDIHTKKTFKGVQKSARDTLSHLDYLRMFQELPTPDGSPDMVLNRRFGTHLHEIYTLEQRKRGLVPFDDKRLLLDNIADGVANPNTHAYGHYSVEIQAEQILDAPPDVPLDEAGRPIPEDDGEDHLPLADRRYLKTLEPTRDQLATLSHKRKHQRILRQLAANPPADEAVEEAEAAMAEAGDGLPHPEEEAEAREMEEQAGARVDYRNTLQRQRLQYVEP